MTERTRFFSGSTKLDIHSPLIKQPIGKEILVCQKLNTYIKYRNRVLPIEYYSCSPVSSILELAIGKIGHVYSIEDYECIDQTNSILNPKSIIPFDGFPDGTVLTIRLNKTKDMETEVDQPLPLHIKNPSIQHQVHLFKVQCMYGIRRDCIRSKEVDASSTIDDIKKEYLHVCEPILIVMYRRFLVIWTCLWLQ